MSRIGNQPITIPAGVTITPKEREITVKGPKGTLSFSLNENITAKIEDNICKIINADANSSQAKALHGLTRSLVYNAVIGVTEGWSKSLTLV